MKKHIFLTVILFLLTMFAACNKTVSQDSGSDTTATATTGETTSSHSGSSSTETTGETTGETISIPDNATESTQGNEIEIDAGDFMEENTPEQTQESFPTMPEVEQTQPSDPVPTTDAEGYQSIVVRP